MKGKLITRALSLLQFQNAPLCSTLASWLCWLDGAGNSNDSKTRVVLMFRASRDCEGNWFCAARNLSDRIEMIKY
jgi:hypothetical protein